MQSIQPSQQKKINLKSNLEALKYLPRFFNLVWHTSPKLFLINVALRLVKSLLPIAMLWVGQLIIDEVIRLAENSGEDYHQLYVYIAIEFGLAICSNLFTRSINLTDGLLGDLFSNKSSVELIQKSAEIELSQLEDASFYDKLERARRQTNSRVTLMSTILSQAQDIITVVSLIVGLIVVQPLLILLLIVAIIPSFVNEIKFSGMSYSLVRSWTTERRELDYIRYIGASDITAKEVKLFDLAGFFSRKFSSLAHAYYLANRKLSIKKAIWGSLLNIIGDLSYYGAYIYIILRTVAGVFTIGQLTFLAGSFQRLRTQLQQIFSRFTRITESALYLKDYFDFIDLEYIEPGGENQITTPKKISQGFVFDNVSFKYPESEMLVLDKVNFTLKAGEKLALVGENGAGKTTLIKLLLRMYVPTEGRILLDGIDIKEYSSEAYQSYFGVIFQDFVKYYFTAKENIAIGKIDKLQDQNRIEHAAEQSLANEVINTLPNRYNQQLGKRFHKGAELSGGQWQKIALARAYMKNAQVVILDEPTSALDARAEYEAFERFTALTKDKTAVLISHRFSTVRMADRILVLKDGRVLEIGSHEELLENRSLYAELFNFQAQGYQ